MTRLWVSDGGDGLQIWKVIANILNKHWWTVDKGWSSNVGFGEGLTTPRHKKPACYDILHRALELVGCYEHGNEPLFYTKSGKFLH
jgi:hypothetical protein